RAHVSGMSLGGAVGMWLAAKQPDRVKSLSIHGAWTKTDSYIDVVVKGWQATAKATGSVPDTVIDGIFPWCFTPEFYATKFDVIQSLAAFVRSPPPMSVDAFIQQSDAVLAHDVESQLSRI